MVSSSNHKHFNHDDLHYLYLPVYLLPPLSPLPWKQFMQTLFSTADIGLDDVLSNASTVAKFMTLDLSLPSKEVEALVHSTVNVQMVSFQSTSTYLGGAPEEERKMSLRWLNKFTCMLHGVVISFLICGVSVDHIMHFKPCFMQSNILTAMESFVLSWLLFLLTHFLENYTYPHFMTELWIIYPLCHNT